MKYELIVEHEGDLLSVVEFAREISAEFGCKVIVNELSTNGNVISPLIEWETYKTDKVQTADSRG